MLVATDELEGDKWAEHLEDLNNSRKGQVAAITKEARKIMEERYTEKKKVIVIGNPDWKPGLLGLVANALLETNGGAVFVWGREGGENLKASCRADASVNVVELMNLVPKDVILDFGGHQASGGLTISGDLVHTLEDHLNVAYEQVSSSIETAMLEIDAVINPEELVPSLWQDLEKFRPFGVGNPKPVFLVKGAELISVKAFGKEKNHTELIIKTGRNAVTAIAFFCLPDSWGRELNVGDKVDMVVNLEKNVFRGRTEKRLRIVEVL
jgi:single-stranded-DNA-specific exonuclease